MSRQLSSTELNALSSFLPEGLTAEQLDSILEATKYACEEAYKEGQHTTAAYRNVYRRAEK